VRLVQALQRLAIASLDAVQVGELARHFALENEVAPLERDLLGAEEVGLGCRGVAGGTLDEAVDVLRFTGLAWIADLGDDGTGTLARVARARVVVLADAQLGDLELDIDQRAPVTDDRAQLTCLEQVAVGDVESLRLGVELTEIGECHDSLFDEAGPAGVLERGLVVLARGVLVPTHVGDHAQVRRDHRRESCVTGTVGALARREVQSSRVVQVSLLPLDDGKDVHGVAARAFILHELRDGQRCRGTVDGSAVVGVLHPRARDETEQLRGVGRGHRRAVMQCLLVQLPCPPSLPAAFEHLSAVDDGTDAAVPNESRDGGHRVGRTHSGLQQGAHALHVSVAAGYCAIRRSGRR